MSDRPIAGFTTFLVIAPLMLICCAAPILGFSVITGIASWFAGAGGLSAIFFGLLAAIGVMGFIQWRRSHKKRNTELREKNP